MCDVAGVASVDLRIGHVSPGKVPAHKHETEWQLSESQQSAMHSQHFIWQQRDSLAMYTGAYKELENYPRDFTNL